MKTRFSWPQISSWILLFCSAVILFTRYLAPAVHFGSASTHSFQAPGDFAVYLLAWRRVKSGIIPYVISDGSPYKYSPFILGLLGLLPEDPGRAWLVFGGLSLFFWMLAILWGHRFESWSSFGKLVFGLVLSWKGILESLDYGQMEFFLFFIAICGARIFLSNPFASGFLLGFLPSFKLPWLAFFAPFFLKATQLPRKVLYQLVGGYVLSFLLWTAILPFALFGGERTFSLTSAWFQLLHAQPYELYASNINQSFLSFGLRSAARWGATGSALAWAVVLILSGVAIGSHLVRIQREEYPTQNILGWSAPWMIFTQLINPLAWRWGSVLVIGVPFAERQQRLSARKYFIWGMVGILWCLQQTPIVNFLGFSHWTDLHPYNWITLYWFFLIFL